jgi:hypothetical protein
MPRRSKLAPSDKTGRKLREVEEKLLSGTYGHPTSDADRARNDSVLAEAVRAEIMAIEAEFRLRSVFSLRLKAAIGSGLPTIQLAIVAVAAVLLVGIVVVGAFFTFRARGGP